MLVDTLKLGGLAENGILNSYGLVWIYKNPDGCEQCPGHIPTDYESVLNGLDMCIAIIYTDDVVVPGRAFAQAADGLQTTV